MSEALQKPISTARQVPEAPLHPAQTQTERTAECHHGGARFDHCCPGEPGSSEPPTPALILGSIVKPPRSRAYPGALSRFAIVDSFIDISASVASPEPPSRRGGARAHFPLDPPCLIRSGTKRSREIACAPLLIRWRYRSCSRAAPGSPRPRGGRGWRRFPSRVTSPGGRVLNLIWCAGYQCMTGLSAPLFLVRVALGRIDAASAPRDPGKAWALGCHLVVVMQQLRDGR